MNVDGAAGPLVAVAAGAVSFLSPCVLPLVPVYAAQMAGASAAGAGAASRWATFLRSVCFVAGFSTVFITLGASVGLAGNALRDHLELYARVAGAILIVLGLHQAGIVRIPWLYRGFNVAGAGGNPAGYTGWLLVGGAVSIGWVPCVGPVLGSILTYAASRATVGRGALLLAFYSLGLGLPFLATGLAAGSVGRAVRRARRWMPAIEVASGVLLIVVGILVFANRTTMFNRYFDMFGIGENGGL